MSGFVPAAPPEPVAGSGARLAELFDELSGLCGQRNAIDGRIVAIVAEIDRDRIWGNTGARSVAGLVAWKTGTSTANAQAIAAIAHRYAELPRCTAALREGRLSLDQVGVIAQRGGAGCDEHYATLAAVATVNQLRTAIKLEPRGADQPGPVRSAGISKTSDANFDFWRITLAHSDSARFAAALASHRDALFAEWTRDHGPTPGTGTGGAADGDAEPVGGRPPIPTNLDAFRRLVDSSWDAEVARRPHGQRTTVIVHLDLAARIAALHLGPLLTESERRYLTCDATCEVWFERAGHPIGCGRATRVIGRRLRRALEHRDSTCRVPGCGATYGLQAHHLIHWEDGGPTELENLILLCPYHHRLHHKGQITIIGPAHRLVVTDGGGAPLHPGSLARPPTGPPPSVAPYRGPTGERAEWWWYQPFQPQPPPTN